MKKILGCLILCLSISNGFASSQQTPSLQEFFENELYQANDILFESESAPANYVYKLSKIRFRIRGKAGLEVPFLAKLEIKPFIEFHFTN